MKLIVALALMAALVAFLWSATGGSSLGIGLSLSALILLSLAALALAPNR